MTKMSRTTAETSPGWFIFNVAAGVLALAGLISLLLLLFMAWANVNPWDGLILISEVGLPVAFVMMGIGLLRAVARRRRL